jgi:hypothetical protein
MSAIHAQTVEYVVEPRDEILTIGHGPGLHTQARFADAVNRVRRHPDEFADESCPHQR